MSKDNVKNNYFSTDYAKILLKKKKTKKKNIYMQMGFKA
jgi:hypothetical protein